MIMPVGVNFGDLRDSTADPGGSVIETPDPGKKVRTGLIRERLVELFNSLLFPE
jgi:hypothetical protein